jgi:two-component system NarL family response regulator
MRLAIVEDNSAILENLRLVLGGENDITVVGAYDNAEDALKNLSRVSPEIMLVDLGLPRMSGVELIACAKIQAPTIELLVYTVFDDWKSVFPALKAGATGYVLKGTKPRELVEAITGLYMGGAPMSPKIARMVIREFQDAIADAASVLTTREKEILSGMDKHMTYKEIAVMMHISPHTVRTHIRNIYDKLQAKNREEALRKAKKDSAI